MVGASLLATINPIEQNLAKDLTARMIAYGNA